MKRTKVNGNNSPNAAALAGPSTLAGATKKPRRRSPEDRVNEIFSSPDPLMLSDAEINKATGIRKRAQEQMGIPLPAETRRKISEALKGRRISAEHKSKISASLKRWHQARRESGA